MTLRHKPRSVIRRRLVQVKFSDLELEMVRHRAQVTNLTLSELIRRNAMFRPLPRQLSKIELDTYKDGVCFSGTSLGAALTLRGLQKHLGVKGFLEEDRLQIEMLFERIALEKPVDDDYIIRIQQRRFRYSNPDSEDSFIPDIQYDYATQIAPILRSLWEREANTIEGKNYRFYIDSDSQELVLTRTKNKEKIIAYIPLDSRFEPKGIELTPEDVQKILASLSKNTQPSMEMNKQPELPALTSNNSESRGFER